MTKLYEVHIWEDGDECSFWNVNQHECLSDAVADFEEQVRKDPLGTFRVVEVHKEHFPVPSFYR